MTGDRPTTPGWHCHRCRSTSCRQRADSDTDHVGRVEYRPLLLTQPSSVSWLWSHTHWCPSQRPQEVMRVDGSANPTMPLKTQPSIPDTQRVTLTPHNTLQLRHDQPAMRRRCRIRRCASLAGGGLSAARTVAFARGEASIAARCMRHDSRQAPRRRPVAAVRHATAAEAPATHWAGRQKARAALASATRLMSETGRRATPCLVRRL